MCFVGRNALYSIKVIFLEKASLFQLVLFFFLLSNFILPFLRYTKPEFCPDCNVNLGGNYVPKVKAEKKKAPQVGDTVCVSPGVYSVRYHQQHRFVTHFNGAEYQCSFIFY